MLPVHLGLYRGPREISNNSLCTKDNRFFAILLMMLFYTALVVFRIQDAIQRSVFAFDMPNQNSESMHIPRRHPTSSEVLGPAFLPTAPCRQRSKFLCQPTLP